jgi:hypothetical protein
VVTKSEVAVGGVEGTVGGVSGAAVVAEARGIVPGREEKMGVGVTECNSLMVYVLSPKASRVTEVGGWR